HKSFKCDANGGAFAPPLKCPSPRASRSLARLGMTAAGSRFAHARKAPSLLVLNIHVLSVDYAFVFLLASPIRAGRRAVPISRPRAARPRCPARSRLRSLIHLLRQLVRSCRQLLACRVHSRLVAAFDGFL